MMFRQGDVLIFKAAKDAVTAEHKAVPLEGGAVVLAHGEVTGHKHQIHDPGVCLLSREGISDRVMTVLNFANLVHEEHSTIEIPAGTYTVRIQREYSETEFGRQVAD